MEQCKLHVSLFLLVKNKKNKNKIKVSFCCFCPNFPYSFVEPSVGMVDTTSTVVAMLTKFIMIWIFSNRWYFLFIFWLIWNSVIKFFKFQSQLNHITSRLGLLSSLNIKDCHSYKSLSTILSLSDFFFYFFNWIWSIWCRLLF